jgi:hypothetical protein
MPIYKNVLRRLPNMKNIELDQITPAAWAKARKLAARSKNET